MVLKEEYTLSSFCGRHVLKSKNDAGRVIKFNETAAFMWKAAKEKGVFAEEDLLAALCAEYEVEEDVARNAVRQTVEGWRDMGLLCEP